MPGKIWSQKHCKSIEKPAKVDAFLEAYAKLCREYNISFSHEDPHGSFIIENFSEGNITWAQAAALDREYEE